MSTVVENLVGFLAPGGWMQTHELNITEDSPGHTPALEDMKLVMRTLHGLVGGRPGLLSWIGQSL